MSAHPARAPELSWRESHRWRRGAPLTYCRECRCAGRSTTTHCVGRMLTDAEEAAISSGQLDFVDGQWIEQKMTTPKTPTQRVEELRQRRKEQGLQRLELYVHPEDARTLKEKAAQLTTRRARWATKGASKP
jgi:hypothetical protein